jgi:hypothetical protein
VGSLVSHLEGASVGSLPLTFANHHRDPTSRNRQSEKNSGGFPSKACPINCSIHPTTNSPSATQSTRCHTRPAANKGSDSRIIGIPNVWVIRFTGCRWLSAYCAIHDSQLRPANMPAIVGSSSARINAILSSLPPANWRVAEFRCSMPQLRCPKWRNARPILGYSPPPILVMRALGALSYRPVDGVALIHPPAPLRYTKASPIPVPPNPNPGDNKCSNQQSNHAVPLCCVQSFLWKARACTPRLHVQDWPGFPIDRLADIFSEKIPASQTLSKNGAVRRCNHRHNGPPFRCVELSVKPKIEKVRQESTPQ